MYRQDDQEAARGGCGIEFRETVMNINQMKEAIKKFRAADFSGLKDEELRAKAQKLQAKQGGFTLLELLVVITLLATLATAALVAYEGIGENAQDTAIANNTLSAENSIRNFRAVENRYPNQWDNLANLDGDTTGVVAADGSGGTGALELLAPVTKLFFGQLVINSDDTIIDEIAGSLNAVGIDEFQTLTAAATFTNAVPNLSFNESAEGVSAPASELELSGTANATGTFAAYLNADLAAATPVALSIVPSGAAGTCTVNTIAINTNFAGVTEPDSNKLNLINDALGNGDCHLVIAAGFGKDVPGTTLGSRVAIAQAPTAVTANVNPATNYARYIALFQVGEDTDGDGDIEATEILPRARLIGVVDPEGHVVDQAIAGANADA
jgi:prepilin-type N-terminal cleavage/methylation domain-containing protein